MSARPKRKRIESESIADRITKRTRTCQVSEVESDEEIVSRIEKVEEPQDRLVLPITPIEEISASSDSNWDQWISATRTRNYMMRDPLCDWLERHCTHLAMNQPHMTSGVLQAVSGRRSSSDGGFTQYIMGQGVEFEAQVLRLIIERIGVDMVLQVGGELNSRSPAKVQETVDAMMRGVPIIHSGLLHNPENQTFGIPDLIVRSDWLEKLVLLSPYSKNEKIIPAPRLRDVHDTESPPEYHYVIVDIKFSTLYFRADATHLLNCGSFPAFKAQLHIYNEALAKVQGYKPPKAFVLGRKWCFTTKGETFKGRSCFDRLGTINYETIDEEYKQKTQNALQWVRDVRSPEAEKWQITNPPLARAELYPNMSNHHDWPWHSLKDEIAGKTDEITSLWMMGIKNRDYSHAQEIYKWTDPKCNVDTLGVKGAFTRNVLTAILEINQPVSEPRIRKVKPAIIQDDRGGWQAKPELEFYVDFEYSNDVITDFRGMPEVESCTLIFMIGIGYIEPVTKSWVFREFTANAMTLADEKIMCANAAAYIRNESSFYEVENPKCLHWAAAENTHWTAAVERHYPDSNSWCSTEWEWFDLLQVFRQEPIVIEGCLGFGLKTIATTLKKHGCIATGWDGGSSCLDGQGAMIGAWNAHKQAQAQGISMRDTPIMREIGRYNEVDVKVLYEIVTYLRLFHTQSEDDKILEELLLSDTEDSA